MRKSILKTLGAALLASTALWPVPAQAEPISLIIGAIASSVGGALTGLGLAGVGGALAGLGSFSAAGFAAGFALGGSALFGSLLKIGLSVGASLLAEALRPKPVTPDPGQRMVNMRQNIAYMNVVYGRTRLGGPIGFWQTKGGGRYYNVLWAAHEIDGFEEIFADDRLISPSVVDGTVFHAPYNTALKVMRHDGAAGQIAPPILNGAFAEVTAAHDFAGLAHLSVLTLNVEPSVFTTVYPGGREPAITATGRGKKVFTPSTGLTRWTDNAALVIANWITSPDGLGREVDWDAVQIEANASAVPVTNRTGAEQKTWTLNGSYLLAESRETVRAQMGVACDAFFFERHDGKVGFHVGRWIEPDITISDRHILAAQYTSGLDGTDPVNAQVVNYTDPSRGYLEAPSAAIEAVNTDNEAREEDQINVFWIDNHNQACRVGKRLLRARRAEWRAGLTLNMQGAKLQERRFFTLNHAEAGIAKVMEIDSLERNEDGITYAVQCHSVEREDFDFNAALEEPAPPKRTTIENDSSIEVVENLTATGVSGGLKVAFDAPSRSSLATVVRVRTVAGPGAWQETLLRAGQLEVTLAGLAQVAHQVQAQHVAGSGRGSAFVPDPPTLTATPGTAPPVPLVPATFSAAGAAGKATLTVKNANDAAVAGVIVRRNSTNTETGATALPTQYGTANQTMVFDDTPLAAGTWYFFARAVNSAGVESTTALSASAVVT